MTVLDVVDRLVVEVTTVDGCDVAEQMTAFHSVFTQAVPGPTWATSSRPVLVLDVDVRDTGTRVVAIAVTGRRFSNRSGFPPEAVAAWMQATYHRRGGLVPFRPRFPWAGSRPGFEPVTSSRPRRRAASITSGSATSTGKTCPYARPGAARPAASWQPGQCRGQLVLSGLHGSSMPPGSSRSSFGEVSRRSPAMPWAPSLQASPSAAPSHGSRLGSAVDGRADIAMG